MPIVLMDRESIVTAWAENCDGPGWTNRIVTVLIRGPSGALREVFVQPHECSDALLVLAPLSAQMHDYMTRWASALAKNAP